ncbi:hypothetical protein Taro_011937 [Colocasia esculenta]|uniref:Uncharacterized protein n=1 Tax=Colocasia esculenta TaxID=4460 RepID=A0A843UHM3_COLES|nr:hypothetical protein [Colocasia esculenta]
MVELRSRRRVEKEEIPSASGARVDTSRGRTLEWIEAPAPPAPPPPRIRELRNPAKVISKSKDKSVDHREIAKAVAICLCGVVLFPSVDHLIDYASLSAISGVWRGLSLSHAVLAHLYSGLTSASTGGFLYGSMILLECWLGVRIKFKPVDNPTTDSRIFGCHPLNFIGGAAKFPDKVSCRTVDKKTRSAWSLYFSTLPVEHFALGIAALRGAEIRLPLGRGLDLQLIGNTETVLYNPQRCYL